MKPRAGHRGRPARGLPTLMVRQAHHEGLILSLLIPSLSRDEGRGPTGFDEREYESVMVQEKILRASLRGAQRRSNPATARSPQIGRASGRESEWQYV